MLSSISPVGEAARGQRWSITIGAYVVGSVMAGATLGALLGVVGQAMGDGVSPAARLVILGILALGALAADLRWRVPSLHRQVDRQWLERYRGWVYGLGFGAQLGLGIVTIIPASVVWVMWLAAVLAGSPGAGAGIGAAFGLLRALPLVLAGRVRTVAQLRLLLSRVDRRRRVAASATMSGQAVVAVTAVIVGMVATFA